MGNKNRERRASGCKDRKERKMGGGGGAKEKRKWGTKSFCFHGDHQLQVHRDKAPGDGMDCLTGCSGHPSKCQSSPGGSILLALEAGSCPQPVHYATHWPLATPDGCGDHCTFSPLGVWSSGRQCWLVAGPVDGTCNLGGALSCPVG